MPKVLEDLMRTFNSEQIQKATGDVFGRIYEYFLAKFSIQKAHDNVSLGPCYFDESRAL